MLLVKCCNISSIIKPNSPLKRIKKNNLFVYFYTVYYVAIVSYYLTIIDCVSDELKGGGKTI